MSSTMDPQMRLSDMGHACDYCKGRSFRRSRLKGKDLGGLLFLRYPVRCLTCSQRQLVSVNVARRCVPSSVHQVRIVQSAGTWNGQGSSTGRSEGVAGPIGGGSFPEVQAQQPLAMPDLDGIALKHKTSSGKGKTS